MSTAPTYSITELAALAGVNPRTVRYYVQRGLIPPPPGRGLGGRYNQEHLDRLLRVRELQRQGVALDRIGDQTPLLDSAHHAPDASHANHTAVAPQESTEWSAGAPPIAVVTAGSLRRQVVTRVEVSPGIWLEFAAGQNLPTGPRLALIINQLRQSLSVGSASGPESSEVK